MTIDEVPGGTTPPSPIQVKTVKGRRVRRVATAILAVLTTLTVIAGTVGVWAHRTVFDTDEYVSLVGPLARDSQVQAALSTFLTDQVVQAIDLKTRISDAIGSIERLPKQARLLAGPIADAATDEVHKLVSGFIASKTFQQIWVEANRVGHEKVVALLRGDYDKLPNISVSGTEVRLNTIPIVTRILRNLAQQAVGLVDPDLTIPEVSANDVPEAARQRLSQALGVTLPRDFGQLPIMSKNKLHSLQEAVDRADRLLWALIALSVVLAAATIAVAVNRRKAVVQLGVGIVAGLVLGAVVIRRVEGLILEQIKSYQARGAAHRVLVITFDTLRDVGAVVLLLGLVAAVVAHVVGRPAWLTRAMGWARAKAAGQTAPGQGAPAWVGTHAEGLQVAGVGLALVVIYLSGIGWLSVLVVGVLLGLYLAALGILKPLPPAPAGGPVPGPPAREAGKSRGG